MHKSTRGDPAYSCLAMGLDRRAPGKQMLEPLGAPHTVIQCDNTLKLELPVAVALAAAPEASRTLALLGTPP